MNIKVLYARYRISAIVYQLTNPVNKSHIVSKGSISSLNFNLYYTLKNSFDVGTVLNLLLLLNSI